MAERVRKVLQKTDKQETPSEDLVGKGETDRATVAAIDEVLDDIDAVLQENAEEFVKAYVQKGGE